MDECELCREAEERIERGQVIGWFQGRMEWGPRALGNRSIVVDPSRLQTVTESQNPLYHRLIREFGERTGIPIVLNTSFNENEPIVNRPEEALDCFLRTKMDVLVLDRTMVERV
jgi:predicted NodU family carbamoyl transferase